MIGSVVAPFVSEVSNRYDLPAMFIIGLINSFGILCIVYMKETKLSNDKERKLSNILLDNNRDDHNYV
jgi:hypothetical protein